MVFPQQKIFLIIFLILLQYIAEMLLKLFVETLKSSTDNELTTYLAMPNCSNCAFFIAGYAVEWIASKY